MTAASTPPPVGARSRADFGGGGGFSATVWHKRHAHADVMIDHESVIEFNTNLPQSTQTLASVNEASMALVADKGVGNEHSSQHERR